MLRQFDQMSRALGVPSEQGREHPFARLGPCVLRIFRNEAGLAAHEVIHGKRDYSRANSKGSRGVMVNYVLEQDEIYQVKDPRSWRSVSYYHCAVTPSGDIRRLSDEEVREWLSAL